MNALFRRNMSGIDRLARAAVAFAIVALALSGALTNTVALLLGTVAVILLVTSATGVCPLYSLVQGRKSGPTH